MSKPKGDQAAPIEIVLPATSANLGPAFDSAAIALRLHFRVAAEAADEYRIAARGRDVAICGSVEKNLLLDTYREVLASVGEKAVPLSLTVENDIQIGKGLGSSAAARLAGIALAVHFGGLEWSDNDIFAEAARREKHGDNVAACWFGGVAIVHAKPVIGNADPEFKALRLRAPAEWPLLVAVPEAALSTEKSRAILPNLYPRTAAVANVQSAMLLTAAFVEDRPELLRDALEDRLHEPYRGPLCPLLAPLRSLTGQHGILGVVLSGAGPSVLVIVDPKQRLAETLVQVAQFLHERGLDAELLVSEVENHGACERRTTGRARLAVAEESRA